jgi:pyridinium-3,5-biscarboxylic acid mononucleotide sulfurtransferase
MTNLEAKTAHLQAIIGALESVVVAFSAGVDSSYLLVACRDTLGPDKVLAVTAGSASLPEQELDEARALAAQIGVSLEIVTTDELANADYVRNDPNRCFHCKDELFTTLWPLARARGFAAVVYGATADDLGDHRPGMQAAQQHGIRAPLLEAGLGKADIRALSQQRGLPTHDKPAMACLASRIPYGRAVTVEALGQVAQAEAFLKREIGLRQVRVRHHGEVARLEVEPDDILRVAQPAIRRRIQHKLREIGFTYVTLDLAGFRSGSLNEGLPQPAQSEQAVVWLEPSGG